MTLGALLLCAGCYSGLRDGGPFDDGHRADGGGDPSDSSGDGDEPEPAECDELRVGASSMRRMTAEEYDNTVRDLLGDLSGPARSFTADEFLGGFATNSVAFVSEAQVTQYVTAAEALARTAVQERLPEWLACDWGDSACVRPFLEWFATRAFRRPATEAELAQLAALHAEAASAWGGERALELVLQAILASPSFIYHVERGEPTDGGPIRLTAWEVASRLSYFLWSTMPDDELFAAAEAGRLGTPEEIEAQARRMIADARFTDTITSFHEQWLHLRTSEHDLRHTLKDPDLYPGWNEALIASMLDETTTFVEYVLREDDGRISTLLSAPYTFVDASLGGLYGITVEDDAITRVDLDPEQRAGLLTHAGLMAALAQATDTSWVHRGLFVRTQLFCQPLPPPPPNADMDDVNDPDRLDDPECGGCHALIDPIGQAFDRYDAIGAYRTHLPDGTPIPAGGDAILATDIDAFESIPALAHALADDETVEACITRQWFRFATRRPEDAMADACSLATLEDAAARSQGDVREILVAIATSEAFRHRASN